jgi:hypothetical protein
MLEIKKLGEKTIRIADTATGRSYTGSATYKASSVGGDTVCLQSIYDDNEPVFVSKVSDITIDGAAQADVNACMVALNAFIGSFERAAANGGGVSPVLGDWIVRVKTSTTPIELTEAQADELGGLLEMLRMSRYLFSGGKLSGRVVLKKVSKLLSDAIYLFSNSLIETLEFPELTEIHPNGSLSFAAINCTRLKEIAFPKLSKFSIGNIWSAFADSPILAKATVHSAFIAVQVGQSVGALYSAPNITDLTITTKITANSELRHQKNLSSASVLHVLQQLDTATTGKYIQFGDIKIAATDPLKAQIQAAIDARTNWTITGITLL